MTKRLVVGGELDELNKEFATYTRYGLLDEIRKLRAAIRGKDNEIGVLKWRVNYLSQFKPGTMSRVTYIEEED